MKLLKQFSNHARKSPVLAHVNEEVLKQIPTYVPNDQPTVPGHEVVLEVVAIGDQVHSVQVGRRYLVQADWRDLKTAGSNGAFGYNFEGGLQQYVLLDERVTIAVDGQSYLLPVDDDSRSHSATALVEPWACVEQAFAHQERRQPKAGGNLLLINGTGAEIDWQALAVDACAQRWCLNLDSSCTPPSGFACVDADALTPGSIDDVVVVGANPDHLALAWPLLGIEGVLAILLDGQSYPQAQEVPVGRVHYGGLRLIGDKGRDVAAAYERIPESGELRPGERICVVGAGGPMGVMACLRMISNGTPDIHLVACNRNPERLAALRKRAEPLAAERGVPVTFGSDVQALDDGQRSYWWMNAPVPELVAGAVAAAAQGGIINIFAGIPATVSQAIDLNRYIAQGLYFIGTSGSTMDDMNTVLGKVNGGELDTNLSIGAVSGMAGAVEGLGAVREGSIPGKIVVYPDLPDLPLYTLEQLIERFPSIREHLLDGCWSKAAEAELLRVAR